jgi:GST-like protein
MVGCNRDDDWHLPLDKTHGTNMITLYGMSSPNVLKISVMLDELAVNYRFEHVNLGTGQQFEPSFVALNPNSKVPVIVDEEGPEGQRYVVFESGAILFYLAEKYERFLPQDRVGRYEVVQWLMTQMSSVGPMLGQLTHFARFAPAGNDYSVSRYRTAAGRVYDMLNRRLAGSSNLAGEDYTIADIATFPWIWLYHEKHGMTWAEHPHLQRWCKTIAARPAVMKALDVYDKRAAGDPSLQPDLPQDGIDRFFGWGRHARA